MERKDIVVVYRIHDCVGVEFITEGLFCSDDKALGGRTSILCEDWSSSEAEDMILLESLDNLLPHLTELVSVALVKYHYNVFVIDWMLLVLGNEVAQFLNCSDDDFVGMRISLFVLVLQLTLKD